jgi:hypothetical protein
MKTKILAALLLFCCLIGLGNTEYSRFSKFKGNTAYSFHILKCQYGQCQANAKSTGVQCKHCVSSIGDKFCYQHK